MILFSLVIYFRTHSRMKGSSKTHAALALPPRFCVFESVNGDFARDVSAATPRRERQPRLSCYRSNADDDAFGRGAHRANESAQIEAGLILLKE
jgi:hypothetical protein